MERPVVSTIFSGAANTADCSHSLSEQWANFSPSSDVLRKIEQESALFARGQLWHVDHFFCSLCGCRIQENEKFEEKAEASVCSHCHLDVVPCAGCLAPIEDKFLQVGSKHWHPTCFTCSVCRQLLENTFVKNSCGLPMHIKLLGVPARHAHCQVRPVVEQHI